MISRGRFDRSKMEVATPIQPSRAQVPELLTLGISNEEGRLSAQKFPM